MTPIRLLMFGLLACVGCRHMNNTEKGAAIGSGMGAIVGTALGAATGNPRTGAVVGALGGALVGGAAGNAEDERQKDAAIIQAHAERDAAQAVNARLGLTDVVSLCQQGTDPDVIINQINATGSTFTLSTSDIQYLTQQNVPARVIRAMQTSRGRSAAQPPQIIVRESPVIIERPIYYGPPPFRWGFHYHYCR